jgi:3-oxoacyl-(acyl-carrier-protein) synthase
MTTQGFMGPNYSISTACATANYAFVSAANHIRMGDADVMVVSYMRGEAEEGGSLVGSSTPVLYFSTAAI